VKTPPRVLIADDNAANLRIMRTRLTADGYEVVTAADGEEALAAARDATPDLILLDIMMPKVDGIEVCRRLKERQNPMFVPIILVTAMADAKDIVAGLEAGADEYLTKPVDHAALAARVRSMLRIKALHDTVAAQADEIARWNTTLEAGGRAGGRTGARESTQAVLLATTGGRHRRRWRGGSASSTPA